MKIIIEKNELTKKYQVKIVYDNGETDMIDFHPYTLPKAIRMAEKALEIINRKSKPQYSLKDVLILDHGGNYSQESDDRNG